MDKDKEDKLLQLIAACWRQDVDPLIVLQRDRFKDEKYVKPRQRVLGELVTLWGKAETSRITGYNTRQLYNIMKAPTIAAVIALSMFLLITGMTLKACSM